MNTVHNTHPSQRWWHFHPGIGFVRIWSTHKVIQCNCADQYPPPPRRKFQKFTFNFFQQFSPYRSVIFSNTVKYLQEELGNGGQNQLQVFFPRKKLLQVCKQEFLQVCKKKKNGKRVSPSKLECPFNPSL